MLGLDSFAYGNSGRQRVKVPSPPINWFTCTHALVRHCRAAPTEDASAPMSTTQGLGQHSRADSRPPPTLVPNLLTPHHYAYHKPYQLSQFRVRKYCLVLYCLLSTCQRDNACTARH